jgi:hypothetical protein
LPTGRYRVGPGLDQLAKLVKVAKVEVPKPSDNLTDEQLYQGLTAGAFQGRDALIAEELLRRRGRYKFGWLGAIAAALWLWTKLNCAVENSFNPLAMSKN